MTKKLIKVQILQLPIEQLLINPKNPRVITDAKRDKLEQSLEDFPEMMEIREIVIDEDHMILGGKMRFQASQRIGKDKVTVKKVTGLTPKQKREFIIKDNAHFGDWDWAELSANWIIQEIEDWGVDVPAIKLKADIGVDDYQIPQEIITDLKPGDLITIGPHRLLCGDAQRADDVRKLMDGKQADLAHNDPPYGMKKEADGVLNDNLNFDQLLAFKRAWIINQLGILKPNASWYCWGMDQPLFDIYADIIKPRAAAGGLTYKQLIIWDKAHGQGQLSETHRQYATADEKCLFVMLGRQSFGKTKNEFPEEWRPLLDYFRAERLKMQWTTPEIIKIIGKTTASHYFTESQFAIPTEELYAKMQQAADGKAFTRSFDELNKEGNKHAKSFYASRAYFDNLHDNMNSVWHLSRATETERSTAGGHVTPKPIELCARVIKTSCPPDGLVVDFFAGTGSTMVTAHQLERTCFSMELDPKWCQVTLDRMRKLAPQLAVSINGKPIK